MHFAAAAAAQTAAQTAPAPGAALSAAMAQVGRGMGVAMGSPIIVGDFSVQDCMIYARRSVSIYERILWDSYTDEGITCQHTWRIIPLIIAGDRNWG